MYYYSTNNRDHLVDFREATINGQPPDKGLYFPEWIPHHRNEFLLNIESYSKEAIAMQVMKPYVGEVIPLTELEIIISQTISFDFPLVRLTDRIYSLELFHGPTMAFKDVGARFMSRCLRYFTKNETRKLLVLVATSGDTGGAVADGFYDVDGVEVVILYPSGKVSQVQEAQLTTYGKNIRAIEVDGSFDHCQQMVKTAFAVPELNKKLLLTSANSINVARWLPQQIYYFLAYRQWENKDNPPVIAVPSGNFGNICAGLLAHRSGLPVSQFIAACNANNTVPEYFRTGSYVARPSVATMSNAMDVGDPSNFKRVLELFDHELPLLQEKLTAVSVSDQDTKQTVKHLLRQYNYLPDPHGAVAFRALADYLEEKKHERGIFLETAHPIKFYDRLEPVTGQEVPIPASISKILGKEKKSTRMKVSDSDLKDFLMSS